MACFYSVPLAWFCSDVDKAAFTAGVPIRELPIVCIDARHANATLKMRPIKTDRNDAAGLAQIMRIGWFKQVRIKSRDCYQIRSLLVARETLVRIRGQSR